MKIINKIKAFFTHHDEPVELDLVAAEIRAGKAFLHPRGEENVTYLVRSDDIEITLSKGRSLSPKDIFKTGPKDKNIPMELKQPDKKNTKQPSEQAPKDSKPTKPPVDTTQTAVDEFDRCLVAVFGFEMGRCVVIIHMGIVPAIWLVFTFPPTVSI